MAEPVERACHSRLLRRPWPGRVGLWILALCALLGVVTTVGVAWGLVGYFGPRPRINDVSFIAAEEYRSSGRMRTKDAPVRPDAMAWPTAVPADWPTPWSVSVGSMPGWRRQVAWGGGFGFILYTDRVGLPWPAMELNRAREPGSAFQGVWSQGFALRRSTYPAGYETTFDGRTRLPLKPHFPGFLIDTLFWGALWLGVIMAFRALRRRRRRRRGLCVQCRYELAGLGRCPECGVACEPGA